MSDNTDINTLRRILKQYKTIAVVGLSANWHRPSSFAAKYMQEHGYRVIPVNPMYKEVLGEKCYPSLRDIPDKVDIVDCFRKSEDIEPIADEAIAIGAKVLWMQIGVMNEKAAEKARKAGLEVVDRRPGGSLWVVDGETPSSAIKALGERGICFQYASRGGSATRHRPGWWWKDTASDSGRPSTAARRTES